MYSSLEIIIILRKALMATNKWQIIIVITDLSGEMDAKTLAEEVKEIWLPPSHDYQLHDIKVGLLESKG